MQTIEIKETLEGKHEAVPILLKRCHGEEVKLHCCTGKRRQSHRKGMEEVTMLGNISDAVDKFLSINYMVRQQLMLEVKETVFIVLSTS